MATGLAPSRPLAPRQKPPRGSRLLAGHPLAQGLLWGTALPEGGGPVVVDLATGVLQTRLDIGHAWSLGPTGPALRFDSAGTGRANSVALPLPATVRITAAPFTFVLRVWLAATGTNSLLGSATTSAVPALRVDGGNTLSLLSQGSALLATSTGTVTAGRWYTLGVTYDPAGVARFYIDGGDVGGGTSSTTFTTGQLHVGSNDATGENIQDGARLEWAYLWRRVLTPAAMAAVHADPYALVAPPGPAPGQWYVTIAAAGGGGAAAGNRWRRTGAKQVSQLKQSSTAQALCFPMIDELDHATPKTGLTPTVTLSKAGAAFASPAGAVTEIGSGWYKVAGNATDTNTLGALILHATATGADPTDVVFAVVAYDPQSATDLGLTNLDATVSTRATQTSVNTIDDYVDTEVAAIKAKTDLIAGTTLVAADIPSATITAINAKTTNLPAAPAAVGDIPTANQNADALLDRAAGVETSLTLRQALRLVVAAAAGKLSGAATTTVVIRNPADSKDRITATVDANGNRSAVTTDLT